MEGKQKKSFVRPNCSITPTPIEGDFFLWNDYIYYMMGNKFIDKVNSK